MAFSGGGGNKQFSPFTMTAGAGQPGQPQQPAPGASPFTFGAGTGAPGFSFGTGSPAAAPSAAPQLSFTAATPAATTSSLFNFGGATATPTVSVAGTTPAAAPSFGFGAPAPAPTNTAPSLTSTFGAPNQPLSFGTPTAAAPSAPAQPTAVAAPLSFTSVPPATATSTVQPTFAVPSTTSGSSIQASTTTASTTITSSAPAAPLTGFSFGTGSTSLTATGAANPIKPTTTTAGASAPVGTSGAGDAATAPATQLTTATTTTQSGSAVSQMNFRQLQEAINKWMLDLQEQEKLFLDQATKVNAWDRTLITNGDKIAKLNESITKVKNDHTRLEHAVDYLKTQQQEFEIFLEPLEAGLPVNIPVEPEREHLYSLTENVDTQLQQMAEDLKEVIRHINECNKTVDKNDPISQILRILNEHTDALQWVEDNANQVRRSLEDVSKQHQMAKKEHERTLRQMFK